MKKILCLFAVLLFGFVGVAGMACASPFLVCDAPPAEQQVISYIVIIDGQEIAWPTAEADGSLRFDLSGITPGIYEFKARAVNIWGTSELSDPYFSPGDVGVPGGITLEP